MSYVFCLKINQRSRQTNNKLWSPCCAVQSFSCYLCPLPPRHLSPTLPPAPPTWSTWSNTSRDFTHEPRCWALACLWEGESSVCTREIKVLPRPSVYCITPALLPFPSLSLRPWTQHAAAELPGPQGRRVGHGGGPDHLRALGRPQVVRVHGGAAQLAALQQIPHQRPVPSRGQVEFPGHSLNWLLQPAELFQFSVEALQTTRKSVAFFHRYRKVLEKVADVDHVLEVCVSVCDSLCLYTQSRAGQTF